MKQTIPEKPRKRAKASAVAAAAVAHPPGKRAQFGGYVDREVFESAKAVLAQQGITITNYLTECLVRKAKENTSRRYVSENELHRQLVERYGAEAPARTTLLNMRASGLLDSLFQRRLSGRVLYDLELALAYFAGRTQTRQQQQQTESTEAQASA
jgi:hypothetical protein